MSENTAFFDYLQLEKNDFSKTRLIVFSGESGAGKSSYIDFLTHCNTYLKNRPIKVYSERPMNWKSIQDKNQTLVIDEVKSPIELSYIVRLLLRGNTLLIANHVPAFLFKVIGLFTPAKLFKIDRQTEKITHYLKSHGYHYSQPTVEAFCKTFGSNYMMLEIVLETGTKPDFDAVYNKFIRFNKVRVQRL